MIVYSYTLNDKPEAVTVTENSSLTRLSSKDAYVMAELLDYYIAEINAINGAITEEFKARGQTVGDAFPTAAAKELLGKLRDAEKGRK
jgi:hypothetical protein